MSFMSHGYNRYLKVAIAIQYLIEHVSFMILRTVFGSEGESRQDSKDDFCYKLGFLC
jgi:hypothetical protein